MGDSMKNFLTLAAAFSFISTASYATTTLDTAAFVRSIQGGYKIKMAGGVAPHEENALADVYADTEEGAFTMPYCDPTGSFCDPGYLFFGYKVTTVTEDILADGSVRDTMLLEDGGKKQTFTWTNKAGTIAFRNEQYVLSGKTIVLEHILEKKIRN